MTQEEIIAVFEETGALLTGHFQLRSGLHSNRFFQAALVLQYPDKSAHLCAELAQKVANLGATAVISPAVGGLIVGQDVARALGVRAIFADKDNDNLILKRGFKIKPGEKVVVAEDVVTRGGRVQQTLDLVRSLGGIPVAAVAIVDRSSGNASFDVPFFSLLQLSLPAYEPANCPLCQEGHPIEHPGSKS